MALRTSVALVVLAVACRPTDARKTEPPDTVVAKPSPEIDEAGMRAFVERFADDAMQGRYSLDPHSIDRAAAVLTKEYETLGLATQRTPFEFPAGTTVARAHHLWVEADGPARALPADQHATLSDAAETTIVADIVYAPVRALGPKPKGVTSKIVLAKDGAKDEAGLREVATHLAGAGARALLVVGDRTPSEDATPWPLPVIAVRSAAAESLAAAAKVDLAKLDAGKSAQPLPGVRLSLASQRTDKKAQADNVIAWIPGTTAKHEIVVVGGHYDHIGTSELGQFCRDPQGDTICNGADDNASGTAVVLGLAKALVASGYAPTRTIVFAHFAAEELGLHGSKALADHPPNAAPFAGAKVVAMVNFDMVGRLGKDGLWVGGVGTSTAWMPMLAKIGTHGIPTVYERSVTSRSDHASFYKHEVPVLFFFTGLHDDYHRPGDEVASMSFDGMAKIATIALDLVVALGDGAAIAYAPPADDEGLVTRMPGSDPRTVSTPD